MVKNEDIVGEALARVLPKYTKSWVRPARDNTLWISLTQCTVANPALIEVEPHSHHPSTLLSSGRIRWYPTIPRAEFGH
jgi:hypothetical protein